MASPFRIASPIYVYAGEEYLGVCTGLRMNYDQFGNPEQVNFANFQHPTPAPETPVVPIPVPTPSFAALGWEELAADTARFVEFYKKHAVWERERVLNLIEEALDDAPPEAQQRLNWLKDMVKG